MPAGWSLRRAYHTPKEGAIAWSPMPTGMKNGSRGLVDGRGDHAVPRYADADSEAVAKIVKGPCMGIIEKGGQMQVRNGVKCGGFPTFCVLFPAKPKRHTLAYYSKVPRRQTGLRRNHDTL